jgi:type I restriction enzyme S subunit
MSDNNLPPDWSWVKLGDAIEKIPITGIKLKQKEYLQKGKYPVVDQGQELIGGYSNDESLVVDSPLPLIVFGDHTKVKKFIDFKFIAGADGIKVLRPKKYYNSKLFYYFLHCIKFPDKGYARHFQYVEKVFIPLLPLPEQNIIVDKIEELFSELDSGVAAIKKAKEQIKTYRQAVLEYAFSGRLFDPLSPIQVVGDINKAAEPKTTYGKQLPEGWKWVKLEEVCEKIQDGSHFSPKNQYNQKGEGRYLYLTSKNIRNNYLDLTNVCYVDKAFHDSIYRRCNPQYGDILLTKDGANTGNVTLNTLTEEFSLLSSVCIIKTSKEKLLPQFVKYYLQSPIGFKEVVGAMSGTAIKRIILKHIKEANIILPPIIKQNSIVNEIEKRFSEADNLEKAIDNSLAKAETLRQSILKQAFEGKLVLHYEIKKQATPFQKIQVIGAIIKGMETYNYHKGEMIIAKYIYLADKIYKLNLGFKYQKWHFGPYSPEIKKILNKHNGYFIRAGWGKGLFYKLTKEDKLFSYSNNLVDIVEKKLPDLIEIFEIFKNTKERDHKIELLASVCKVIEDDRVIESQDVFKKLKEWNTDEIITGFKNKAERFKEDEVRRSLDFIRKQGWIELLAPKTNE